MRIGHISEIDIFVTDAEPPKRVMDMCRQSDVVIEIAEDKIDGEGTADMERVA